jgi:hypothetical protein
VQGGIGNIYLVDCMVGFYREPDTFHANPGDDLQKLVDQLIPGDTLIISGLHVVDLLIRVRGTPLRPIVIKGDGTAVIRGPFGDDEVFSAFHLNHARYLYIHDLIIEHTGRAVFVEDSQHIKLERITARYTRSGGFTTSEYCDDIVHLHCTAHNTGYDLNTGDGFRCGTTPSDWPRGDTVPETTTRIRYENCKAWNNFGDGFDINAAASQVVLKNCSVDFTKGTKPHAEAAVGASGFHCRADKVQFISCSVIGAPLDGFRCFDVLWSKVIYGRNQEVKGGSSTGHGEAGVASQSEGMKVYSDFAASAPRILEVEGGWAGTGSNVNLSTFTEISWVSQALAYFDYS